MSQLSKFHKTLSAQLKAAMLPPYGPSSLSTVADAARTLEIFAAELVREVESLREHVEGLQRQLGIRDIFGLPYKVESLRDRMDTLERRVTARDTHSDLLGERVSSVERSIFGRDRGL